MKVKTLLLNFFLFLICFQNGFALQNQVTRSVKKLQALTLGTTASSVILAWDDPFEPDYQASDFKWKTREYTLYQNGTRIGSTHKKTFTAKNLSPVTDYIFSVTLPESEDPEKWNTVKVTVRDPGKIINIRKSGAKGDGKNDDTAPVQHSINHCPAGGSVYIPAGNYLVGHLELKSDITLELAKDAVLSFIGYKHDKVWPKTKAELSGPDGNIHYESISLLSGTNVHNVVITGEGIIDGNGETWWPYYKEITRPFTLEFVNSSNILVQGITIQDPPFWNNHLLYVDSAVYSDVKFLKVSTQDGVNGDGLNPDASRDILIIGCLFGNQDDAIAIKSGKYVEDGNKRRRSTERIIIRDCIFDGKAAPGSNPLGIAIGSESSGGVKHVMIRDCEFSDVASLVNIKTNRERFFACVEDISIENIHYTNTKHVDRWWNRAAISVDLFYGAPEGSDPSVAESFSPQTPVFSGIHFKNISIYNPAGKGIYISGLPESPVHDIDFDKVNVTSKDGVIIRNVDALSVSGISVIPLGGKENIKK